MPGHYKGNVKTIVGAGRGKTKNKRYQKARPTIKPPKDSRGKPRLTPPGEIKRTSYYEWDAKYNKGWLPGGADNPITTFAKGLIKINTGVDIPNPNKFKLENPEIKTWDDRNLYNRGTKLNP